MSASCNILSILAKAGLAESLLAANLGNASAIACISEPGGGRKAYTVNIIASVINPAVRKKSAQGWWVIFLPGAENYDRSTHTNDNVYKSFS